jgi:hypothetical protein
MHKQLKSQQSDWTANQHKVTVEKAERQLDFLMFVSHWNLSSCVMYIRFLETQLSQCK